MISVFRFSNWNQLSGLKSILYPNLQINVVQFNSEHIIGTKIDIVDKENNIMYFSGFVRVNQSDRFDPLAVFEVDDMIKRINAYGFNIDIIEPKTLPPNVITMLKGLYALGYNYLTMEYSHDTAQGTVRSLYQSDIDDIHKTPWPNLLQHPFTVFSNKYIVVTKNLNDVRRIYNTNKTQPASENIYIISEAPEFTWEDFKWVKPATVYSIELLINPTEAETATPISDAIVDIENLPGTGV